MQATSPEKLPAWAQAMLEAARVGRLGLVDDSGSPRVLPVTYVLRGATIYTAIDEKRKRVAGREPARVRYLRERPQAALTVDHYEDDWSKLAWVQALGSVAVLALEDDPDATSALVAKYEPYRERPPVGPLLRLRCERFLYWRSAG